MPGIDERTAARFWGHVDKRGPEDCWEWTGTRNADGYGSLRIGRKMIKAHRFSWATEHGAIPNGVQILHRCDNPPCCNPAHLFAGTIKDNVADMDKKGRRWCSAGERHPRHKLTWPQVRGIRDRVAAGENQRVLAREYGVRNTTISEIKRNNLWKEK